MAVHAQTARRKPVSTDGLWTSSPITAPDIARHPSAHPMPLSHDFQTIPVLRPQAKLTVSQPGDPQELEAEQMADQVMRAEAPASKEDSQKEQDETVVSGQSLARQIMRDPDPNAPPPIAPPPPADPNLPPSNTADPMGPKATATGSTVITVNPTTRALSAPNLSQLYDAMTGSGTREAASVLPKFTPPVVVEADANDIVTKATVTVVENKEMPSWTELDKQCAPIQNEYNRFIGILDTHENNHIAIDKKHFANLHLKMVGKKQDAAYKALNDEIDAADKENEAYDNTSGHGVNEGAKINSWVQCAPEKVKSSDNSPPDANDIGNQGSAPGLPPSAQAKLNVSQPGDPYEQEADRMADRVMRMPDFMIQRTEDGGLGAVNVPPGGGPLFRACAGPGLCDCPRCRAAAEQTLSRSADGEGAVSDHAAGKVSSVVGSGGDRLDQSTRSFMEPRFGHDFSNVRIHTDSRASDSAAAVNARAYAMGQDVVFGAGQYSPGSQDGQRLLAHELTHVVQQGQSTPLSADRLSRVSSGTVWRGGYYSPPGPPAEPAAPSTLPAVPGSPAASTGPVPPGQFDDHLVATWGWAWNTKLTAGKREARDFDTQATANVYGTSLGHPAAIFQENGKFVVYPVKYTALHSFTYENAKIHNTGTDCDMRGVPGVLAIITEDGVAILPHQLKGEDGKSMTDYKSPMEADDKSKPGEDPFGAQKDVFGKGLGGMTEKEPFIKQFGMALRSAAISALDKSQKEAEDKKKEMEGGALPAKEKANILEVAKQLAAVEVKLTEAQRMGVHSRVYRSQEDLDAEAAKKEAKINELTKERDTIRMKYPALSRVDAEDFLTKNDKEQAGMIGDAAGDVLKDIKITRDNVLTGSLELWSIPALVRATQAGLGGVDEGRKKWIAEKVKEVKSNDEAIQQAIASFQIIFSLAAMVGGPLGVAFAVGALAVSTADAVMVTQQFAKDEAAAGTALDPKKALVPSDLTGRWFNLVVAWVGVGLSYADAVYWARSIKAGTVTVEEASSTLAKQHNVDEGALKSAATGSEAHSALDPNKLRDHNSFGTPLGETHEYKLYDDGRIIRCSDDCDLTTLNFRQRLAEIRSVLPPASTARAEAAALVDQARVLEQDAAKWALLPETEKLGQQGALVERGKQLEVKMASVEKNALPELGANTKTAVEDLEKLLDANPTLKGEFGEEVRKVKDKWNSIKKDAGSPDVVKDKDLRHAAGEDLVSLQAKAEEVSESINAKLKTDAGPKPVFDIESIKPGAKHAEGGWGSPMDLNAEAAQQALDSGFPGGEKKQIYAYRNGQLYEFQPDGTKWHGYIVPGTEVPPDVLKRMEDAKVITSAERKKFMKEIE